MDVREIARKKFRTCEQQVALFPFTDAVSDQVVFFIS